MNIPLEKWNLSVTGNFNFTWAKNLEPESEMKFIGDNTKAYKLSDIWSPGTVRVWLSTKGKWERKIVFPETDESIIKKLENDIQRFFPQKAFTPLDEIFNDKESLVFDYENNEVRWDWYPGRQVDDFIYGCLNSYVFKYPFRQKVTEESDYACLMINAQPNEVGDIWDCAVVSTNTKDISVEKEGNECWFVSCFEDMKTDSGKEIKTGKFYKMSSDIVNLLKTENHNRVLKIIKK